MNRHIAIWATVAIAAFSLTACSSAPTAPVAPSGGASSAPAASAPATEQSSPAAEATSASGQTLAEACIEPSAKLVEAYAELAKVNAAMLAHDGKDAQDTVDALHAMADYFGALAESTSNAEVKKALTGIQKSYDKLAVLMEKLLVKEDLSAAADATKIMAELQESMTAFQKLCTP